MDPIVTRAPFWNLIAIGLPLATFLIGLVVVSGRGGMDYFGRLGGGILLLIGVAAASGLGVIAGVVALYRHERLVWLSVVSIVLNCLIVLPVLGVFTRRQGRRAASCVQLGSEQASLPPPLRPAQGGQSMADT